MRAGKRVPEQPDPKVHLELFSERFCHFFSFDHPSKLAVRLGQDWGSRPAQLPPDFSIPRCPERAKPPAAETQIQPAEPMRYLPVPHTEQTARRAGRPFFIVTCSTSLEPVLARHFKQ